MRRRILNPEFFVDPDIIANLDFGGRLFYQGLWCVAEDSGVFDPNPLGLKMKIFPGDNIDISTIQRYYQTLVRLNKVVEFEANGRTYAWLKNFHKHQKLDRPSPPSLPLPPWVVWHGEEELGKEKHKWYYEVLPEYIPNPSPESSPFDEYSTNSRRTDDEQTTTEENRKEEKLKEEKEKRTESEGGGVGEEGSKNWSGSTASPSTPSLIEGLLSRYSPEQRQLIEDYWETIRFTRKNAKIADSIKIRELEYWSRYPPEIVMEALRIHLARYPTKEEAYTRGIMRRLKREAERGEFNGRSGKSRASPGKAGVQDYESFVLR